MKKIKSVFSLFIILALCVVMSPSVASAAASRVEVYVVSGIFDEQQSGGFYREYKYGKKGLAVKETYYNTAKMVDGVVVPDENMKVCDITYKYNKSNLLKSAVTDIHAGEAIETSKYINKNGKRIRQVHTDAAGYKTQTDYIYHIKGYLIRAGEHQYRCDDNGQMIAAKMNEYVDWIDLAYDDHGNLTVDPWGSYQTKENTYDENGNLVRRLEKYYDINTNETRESNTVYIYKKIRMSKKLLKIVRKQQWSLLNDDMDSYFNVPVGWG